MTIQQMREKVCAMFDRLETSDPNATVELVRAPKGCYSGDPETLDDVYLEKNGTEGRSKDDPDFLLYVV